MVWHITLLYYGITPNFAHLESTIVVSPFPQNSYICSYVRAFICIVDLFFVHPFLSVSHQDLLALYHP